jgi:hypothetical protein
MKRAYLYGLSSFFGAATIVGALNTVFKTELVPGVVVFLISAPACLFTLRLATNAPKHQSRKHAVIGWLLGFLTPDAVIFATIAISVLTPLVLK